MYLAFFGLDENPFAITPDPRYLFPSARHADALAHLVYGVSGAGGFIQLTGEVGTGKTTLVRSLLARQLPDVDVALILNPRVTVDEFLLTICEELGVPVEASARDSIKQLMDLLTARLLSANTAGRRVAVLIDEAHLLERDVLEQVRLLTNLETPTRKLLQIILIGQPELRDLLARDDLRQVDQRITGRYHLAPLDVDEAAAYVRHRLRVAGARTEIFTPRALRTLHRVSGGFPRLINIIADRAMLAAYVRDDHLGKLTRRLQADAKSLYALYQFSRLHGAVRLRWGFLDEMVSAPWVLREEPGLHHLMKRANEEGCALEVVVHRAPGWEEPWARAVLARVVPGEHYGYHLVGEDGYEIVRMEVQAARLSAPRRAAGAEGR